MGPHAEARSTLNGESARIRRFVAASMDRVEITPAGRIDPDRVFLSASRRPYPAYLWGHSRWNKGRYSLVAHSPIALLHHARGVTTLTAAGREVSFAADILTVLADLLPWSGRGRRTPLPFCGGAIGYLTYEAAAAFLPHAPTLSTGPLPEARFALYDRAYLFDHELDTGYWAGEPWPVENRGRTRGFNAVDSWEPGVTRERYMADVRRLLDHIAAGDIYQANYTFRFEAAGRSSPSDLALRLKRRVPTPMGACLMYPDDTIWSLSPERLCRAEFGRTVESRPVKGTRRRGDDALEDARLAAELLGSAKDRAELLMIVDLVRNDLGRVAPYGSVRVDPLFHVERYANVHHLEATVQCDWPGSGDWGRVLRNLLPGGSITGAPKLRAVQILAELERTPRSVYTGGLGYVSHDGVMDFNLPIRTLYHDGTRYYLHSGSGIVADSDPELEWDEVQLKVENIRSALSS